MSRLDSNDDAKFAERYLGDEMTVDAQAAYTRFAARRRTSARRTQLNAGLGALTVATALIVALFATPLGSYARGFLTIFQPKTFEPIAVTSTQINEARLAPHLNAYGNFRTIANPKRTRVASIAQAARLAGFAVRTPAEIPSSLGSGRYIGVQSRGESAFTFSARKTRASMTRLHKPLPPMPAKLDGTTLEVSIGPGVLQAYGQGASQVQSQVHRMRSAGRASADDFTANGEPVLVVVQGRAPRVTSTGASLSQLESYLLAMPGVSPQLAAQIRSLGDPAHTLPVPFRVDKQSAQHVTVDGVPALAIGDNTGLGAGVVWERDGIVYAVGGTLSENEVLRIANGLR